MTGGPESLIQDFSFLFGTELWKDYLCAIILFWFQKSIWYTLYQSLKHLVAFPFVLYWMDLILRTYGIQWQLHWLYCVQKDKKAWNQLASREYSSMFISVLCSLLMITPGTIVSSPSVLVTWLLLSRRIRLRSLGCQSRTLSIWLNKWRT